MIKFFRKIRQRLVTENKFSKYLIYAIGEIVLVVFGILIALSINNWNEKRKEFSVELKMLSEIQSNLKQSKKEIKKVIDVNETDLTRYISLLNYIEQKLPYSAALDTTFGRITSWASPHLTYTAYESLKSKGSVLVRNDSLRMQFINMFENEMTYLIDDWDKSEWKDSESVVGPYFIKHFAYNYLDGKIAKPNNYDALIRDAEFTNILSLNIVNRKWGNQSCRNLINSIDTLIGSIENELVQRGFYKN